MFKFSVELWKCHKQQYDANECVLFYDNEDFSLNYMTEILIKSGNTTNHSSRNMPNNMTVQSANMQPHPAK